MIRNDSRMSRDLTQYLHPRKRSMRADGNRDILQVPVVDDTVWLTENSADWISALVFPLANYYAQQR